MQGCTSGVVITYHVMRKVVKDLEGEEETWAGNVGVPRKNGFIDYFNAGAWLGGMGIFEVVELSPEVVGVVVL